MKTYYMSIYRSRTNPRLISKQKVAHQGFEVLIGDSMKVHIFGQCKIFMARDYDAWVCQ